MEAVAPVSSNNYGRISAVQAEHSNYKAVGAPQNNEYSVLQLRPPGEYSELQLRPPGTDYADASVLASGPARAATQYADASALH